MKRESRRAVATVIDRTGNRGPTLRDLAILATAACAAVIYVSYLSVRDFSLW
jgi:hypothetical protein